MLVSRRNIERWRGVSFRMAAHFQRHSSKAITLEGFECSDHESIYSTRLQTSGESEILKLTPLLLYIAACALKKARASVHHSLVLPLGTKSGDLKMSGRVW